MEKTACENEIKAELRELTERVRRLNQELRAMTGRSGRASDKPRGAAQAQPQTKPEEDAT